MAEIKNGSTLPKEPASGPAASIPKSKVPEGNPVFRMMG
jgi:hypothetical protein